MFLRLQSEKEINIENNKRESSNRPDCTDNQLESSAKLKKIIISFIKRYFFVFDTLN